MNDKASIKIPEVFLSMHKQVPKSSLLYSGSSIYQCLEHAKFVFKRERERGRGGGSKTWMMYSSNPIRVFMNLTSMKHSKLPKTIGQHYESSAGTNDGSV
ncbi:unnamed protein product [Ilex paraguariensis]|uniref:Uncharacterized protein n=1 Tax=Ilex paraguariensis TaxID=185542 RepID=A0ABC8U6F8_9AQUA